MPYMWLITSFDNVPKCNSARLNVILWVFIKFAGWKQYIHVMQNICFPKDICALNGSISITLENYTTNISAVSLRHKRLCLCLSLFLHLICDGVFNACILMMTVTCRNWYSPVEYLSWEHICDSTDFFGKKSDPIFKKSFKVQEIWSFSWPKSVQRACPWCEAVREVQKCGHNSGVWCRGYLPSVCYS